jgi:phenylpyruvate tautomerase PptA (4-oxalocrotonate tautomerase family)
MPLVEIDLLAGTSQQEREAISDAVHEAMVELLDVWGGLREENLAVVLVENRREDWSFGRGQASYLELPPERWR